MKPSKEFVINKLVSETYSREQTHALFDAHNVEMLATCENMLKVILFEFMASGYGDDSNILKFFKRADVRKELVMAAWFQAMKHTSDIVDLFIIRACKLVPEVFHDELYRNMNIDGIKTSLKAQLPISGEWLPRISSSRNRSKEQVVFIPLPHAAMLSTFVMSVLNTNFY